MNHLSPFSIRLRNHLKPLWLGLAATLVLSPLGLAQTFTSNLDGSSVARGHEIRLAQGSAENGASKGRKGRKGKKLSKEERAALKKEVQRKIQTFVTVELATQLELSDEKALKLSKAVKNHLAKRQEARKKIRGERDTLEALIQKNASESELKKQTQKVMEASNAMHDERGFMEATQSFLTTKEQAKLVLSYHHVQKEVRRMVHHAKRKGKGHGNMGPGHGPPGRHGGMQGGF